MTAYRVLGLDLSLTSTGISDGYNVAAIRTGPDSGSLEARTDLILDGILAFGDAPHLAVIEGAAFGAKGSAVDQLAGLRAVVRFQLYKLGVPFAEVPPTTLKAYTCGYGKGSKQQMVAALEARHQLDLSMHKVTHGKYDMADAFALAAMGHHLLGQPLPAAGPPPRMDGFLKVPWPKAIDHLIQTP